MNIKSFLFVLISDIKKKGLRESQCLNGKKGTYKKHSFCPKFHGGIKEKKNFFLWEGGREKKNNPSFLVRIRGYKEKCHCLSERGTKYNPSF